MVTVLRLPNIIFLFELLRSMVITTASVPLIGDRNLRRKDVTALLGAICSKTYPSFLTVKEGSTFHLGLLSSGEKKETALLGARNRYALRLADHQRSSPCYAGWDRLGTFPIIKVSVSLWSRKGCSTFNTKPLFNGLYTPFGSPVSGGQKPQEREDVAGYAIASARVLVSSAEPVPTRGCR